MMTFTVSKVSYAVFPLLEYINSLGRINCIDRWSCINVGSCLVVGVKRAVTKLNLQYSVELGDITILLFIMIVKCHDN